MEGALAGAQGLTGRPHTVRGAEHEHSGAGGAGPLGPPFTDGEKEAGLGREQPLPEPMRSSAQPHDVGQVLCHLQGQRVPVLLAGEDWQGTGSAASLTRPPCPTPTGAEEKLTPVPVVCVCRGDAQRRCTGRAGVTAHPSVTVAAGTVLCPALTGQPRLAVH